MYRYSAPSLGPSADFLESLQSSLPCSKFWNSSAVDVYERERCKDSNICKVGVTIVARPTGPRDEWDRMEKDQLALAKNLPERSSIEKPSAPVNALHRCTGSGHAGTPKRMMIAYNKEIVMGT